MDAVAGLRVCPLRRQRSASSALPLEHYAADTAVMTYYRRLRSGSTDTHRIEHIGSVLTVVTDVPWVGPMLQHPTACGCYWIDRTVSHATRGRL